MQTFYGTLAQVTAGLLAVLTAFAAAYFVFIHERATTFDDQIAQKRLQVRDELFQLRSASASISAPAALLPHEFSDLYRSKYPKKTKGDFILQAATDLLIQHPSLEAALREAKNTDSFEGPLYGRLYAWVLSEAITFITNRPEGVFPSVPDVGFEAWQHDFTQARAALITLSFRGGPLLGDFQNFIGQNQKAHSNLIVMGPLMAQAVPTSYQCVERIQNALTDIDKQRMLKTPYAINLFWFGFWLVFTFIFGVFTPLSLLIYTPDPNRIAAAGILLVTTLCFFVGTLQFWSSIKLRQQQPRASDYLAARWFRPIQKEISSQEARLSWGSLLDRDLMMDAAASTDRHQFPLKLTEALEAYLSAADTYNRSAFRLNRRVLASMRTNPVLVSSVLPTPQNGSSVNVGPAQILGDNEIQVIANALTKEPTLNISFELVMPRWSHVEMVLAGSVFAGDTTKLTAALNAVRNELAHSSELTEFMRARTEVSACLHRLTSELSK